jgi:hypothetical protein
MNRLIDKRFNRDTLPITTRFFALHECTIHPSEKIFTLDRITEELIKLEGEGANIKACCDVIDKQLAEMVLRCLRKEAHTGPVGYCIQQRLRSLILAVSRLKTV